ncbi:B3 domain-containing protein Os03g0622200-like isoform X1 [Neltuma alba]|uniref:B3 domain-containing protein Os03g0622200-like isoform X1 n=2 Tax=Neltuma alba TaxID=207710 RepID=UPI0010A327CD|nr:B3 domain-containing protein Os03g0622200-like isoform X1 [Prosopis alba]
MICGDMRWKRLETLWVGIREMGQTGERCRALERHIYWTEFAPNRHQFFKLMMGDFRNQLRIPRKFVSHFKEELRSAARLIGPSRNVWIVKIARTDDDIVFQIGWEKFVQDHSLAERDFLVFHYIGYSSFNVSIFDETGCEREGAFFVNKHISCTRNECFLQNDEEKILQITDVEETEGKVKKDKLKGRDGEIGEVRERNLKSKTSVLVGTSFEASNSNIETFGDRKEDLWPKRKK